MQVTVGTWLEMFVPGVPSLRIGESMPSCPPSCQIRLKVAPMDLSSPCARGGGQTDSMTDAERVHAV